MSLLDMLTQQIGGAAAQQMARQLGADQGATSKAIAGALPALVGALARNAASSNGAESLSRALTNDHDGSVLGDIGGFLNQAEQGPGEGILGHILGSRRDTVQAGSSGASGLDVGTITKLLPMLAPLVIGALGQQQRKQGLDAGGLASMLNQEHERFESSTPGLVGNLLDADGDGSVTDDLARMGTSLLGKLLSGR